MEQARTQVRSQRWSLLATPGPHQSLLMNTLNIIAQTPKLSRMPNQIKNGSQT